MSWTVNTLSKNVFLPLHGINNNKNLSNICVAYVKSWHASFKQLCPYQFIPREIKACSNFKGVFIDSYEVLRFEINLKTLL